MSGEKTEQPTPKRERDARNKGQVAVSKEVVSTALLVAIFTWFMVGWKWMFGEVGEMILLPATCYHLPFEEALPKVLSGVAAAAALVTLPFLGLVIAGGIASNYFQVGALFTLEPLKPDLKKLNPIDKIKQMFSMKNLVEFLKSNFKIAFLGVLLYIVIRDAIGPLTHIPYGGLEGVTTLLAALLFRVALFTMLAYVIIAVADLFFQKHQHTKQLMMTKEEVKQEYKEMEGDPTIKSKRKQLHQELVMGDASEKVKKSSVLVTNPTHYAIAIYYEKDKVRLPMILAKGEGALALRMIKTAEEAGVPIMRNIPLAHNLFDNAMVDKYIPADLIEPVAEVLRWVMQLRQEEGEAS